MSTKLSEQDVQEVYARQCLELLHVANEIRAGRGEALAERVAEAMAGSLGELLEFPPSATRTACFLVAGSLYAATRDSLADPVAAAVSQAALEAKRVLSDDCYAPAECAGGAGCTRWPTSLTPVDPDTPDPMGWRYVVGSHCGFHWPKFWKLDCGNPVGLIACTG